MGGAEWKLVAKRNVYELGRRFQFFLFLAFVNRLCSYYRACTEERGREEIAHRIDRRDRKLKVRR